MLGFITGEFAILLSVFNALPEGGDTRSEDDCCTVEGRTLHRCFLVGEMDQVLHIDRSQKSGFFINFVGDSKKKLEEGYNQMFSKLV